MTKNIKFVFGGAIIGFLAPVTVAITGGVEFGTYSAGFFAAAAWILSLAGAGIGHIIATSP